MQRLADSRCAGSRATPATQHLLQDGRDHPLIASAFLASAFLLIRCEVRLIAPCQTAASQGLTTLIASMLSAEGKAFTETSECPQMGMCALGPAVSAASWTRTAPQEAYKDSVRCSSKRRLLAHLVQSKEADMVSPQEVSTPTWQGPAHPQTKPSSSAVTYSASTST